MVKQVVLPQKDLQTTWDTYVAKVYEKLFRIPFRNARTAKALKHGFPLPLIEGRDYYSMRQAGAVIDDDTLLSIKDEFDTKVETLSRRDNSQEVRALIFEQLWMRKEGTQYMARKREAEERAELLEYVEQQERLQQREKTEQARKRAIEKKRAKEKSQRELEDTSSSSEPEEANAKRTRYNRRAVKVEEEEE